jgi:hypothetical protein
MNVHRSTRPAQDFRHNHRAGRHRSASRRRPHPGTHRPQWRGQEHRAQRHSRPHILSGRAESARDEIPGPNAISLCAMSASSPMSPCCRAGCAFRRRSTMSPACIRASIAPRPNVFSPRPPSSVQQGEGIVEGHGDPAAPCAGHGHRREIAGAGRADARPRHSLSQAILRFAAE